MIEEIKKALWGMGYVDVNTLERSAGAGHKELLFFATWLHFKGKEAYRDHGKDQIVATAVGKGNLEEYKAKIIQDFKDAATKLDAKR